MLLKHCSKSKGLYKDTLVWSPHAAQKKKEEEVRTQLNQKKKVRTLCGSPFSFPHNFAQNRIATVMGGVDRLYEWASSILVWNFNKELCQSVAILSQTRFNENRSRVAWTTSFNVQFWFVFIAKSYCQISFWRGKKVQIQNGLVCFSTAVILRRPVQ